MGNWLASLLPAYSSPHPSVSVIYVGGLGKLVNVASFWILCKVLLIAVGEQCSSCRPGNKTLLWAVSGCDENSFDVGQEGDVDCGYLEL